MPNFQSFKKQHLISSALIFKALLFSPAPTDHQNENKEINTF
jgi:hypothetical protein